MQIEFEMEKTTKNTVKFAEILESELDSPKIGNLYVQKAALKEVGWSDGKRLSVSLEVEDAEE